jgi:hypothetical protein
VYAEEDEEDFRRAKALAQLRAPYAPKFAVALEVFTWAEEREEPHTRLKRFHDWLQSKGDDPTAVLARRWVIEFKEAQEEDRPHGTPRPSLHSAARWFEDND